MTKTLLATALFIIFSLQAASQHIITGIVKDESGAPLIGANILEKGTTNGTVTDIYGNFSLRVSDVKNLEIIISSTGYLSREYKVSHPENITITLSPTQMLAEIVITGSSRNYNRQLRREQRNNKKGKQHMYRQTLQGRSQGVPIQNTESYSVISANRFKKVNKEPLSTFSIDVDRAAYANVRRFINNGQEPPKDAVRIEEMINYFNYDYPSPTDDDPISITSEMTTCPWNSENDLLHIGLKAREIPKEELPSSNLVFLIDVSGSMSAQNKLPLLQKSMTYLVNNLTSHDQVAIVVYAGSSGIVLPPTSGDNKQAILDAVNRLRSGGSTAGAQGIRLAYEIASQHKDQFDNSRVILATDGDFNVGISSERDLQKLIEEKRKTGIYLTCLGFGMGNLKDSKLEILANKGNGNYGYIDNIQEARKILGAEFSGTIFTIAKDVKIQIEFNPLYVSEYKLIGYENRLLDNEDFDNDQVDAGEIGLGHTVTALYEIKPSRSPGGEDTPLRYSKMTPKDVGNKNEVAYIKMRYKHPKEEKSRLMKYIVSEGDSRQSSDNVNFSSAVALFGMLLRENKDVTENSYSDVIVLAHQSLGHDEAGYKREFIRLVSSVNEQIK